MDKVIKGRRTRTEGMKWLIKTLKGLDIYVTDYYMVPHTRFSKDAFGVADAFIITREDSLAAIMAVQFKTNEWGGIRNYILWCLKNKLPLYIVRKDHKRGFRMKFIDTEGCVFDVEANAEAM